MHLAAEWFRWALVLVLAIWAWYVITNVGQDRDPINRFDAAVEVFFGFGVILGPIFLWGK